MESHPPDAPLAGRYRVEAKLGAGGMGSVFRAVDVTSGRVVAIKLLHRNLADQVEFLKRFEREARVMAQLSHPNLLQLVAVDHHDGLPFLVMPFIEGQSLRAHLKAKRRFSAREALPVLEQLCLGLGHLHSRGVVHRDVKPDNVLLSSDGHVTLLDFGISRKGGPTDLTSAGQLLGTPRYISPEQVLDHEIDFRADLYSLGLLAYHLLTGVTPFGDNGPETILKHIYETPELASRLSPAVSDAIARVLAKALSKEPAGRHPSAQAFFDDFALALSVDATAADTRRGDPVHASPPAEAETIAAGTALPAPGSPATETVSAGKRGLIGAVKRLFGGD